MENDNEKQICKQSREKFHDIFQGFVLQFLKMTKSKTKQNMTIYSQKRLHLWTFEEVSFERSRLADSSVKML